MELRDLRSKIPPDDDDLLSAVAKATDIDKSELVREIIHGWFLKKRREYLMVSRIMRGREGFDGAQGGGLGE